MFLFLFEIMFHSNLFVCSASSIVTARVDGILFLKFFVLDDEDVKNQLMGSIDDASAIVRYTQLETRQLAAELTRFKVDVWVTIPMWTVEL